MSFDPVALGYLLGATGPVTVASEEELNWENAAALLLNESYFLYPGYEEQDLFFASAASSIFDAVKCGQADTMALITAMSRAIDERRLNLWSADPVEQEFIATTPMAGILPVDNVETTAVGVYFNDDSSAKLEYYLDTAISITSDQCTNAIPSMHGTVTLVNNSPADAATSLPEYMRGSWYRLGVIMVDLAVYGPVGGSLGGFAINGAAVAPEYLGSHLGRSAAKIRFHMSPGETAVVDYDMTGLEGEYGPIDVRQTPMVRPTQVAIATPGC